MINSVEAELAGVPINCSLWYWYVLKDGVGIDDGLGNTISNYQFDNVGTYTIKFFGTSCGFPGTLEKEILVNSRVKSPNPIVAVTNPLMCVPGQAYEFKTYPPLDIYDENCYFHYDYEWEAPTGWDIDGGGNVILTPSANVDITAPSNTPSGVYTISVRATIPSDTPGVPFKSTKVNYDVQVGSLNSSQIYVIGQQSVCPGNSYLYSAILPGGHKTGYVYTWTYPSGWNVQSSNANQITLYVPSFNPSYGAVRVSVETGCESPTGFSGLTVFPCNNLYGDFMIFPNPTETELNVEYVLGNELSLNQNKDSGSSTSKNELLVSEFRVELYDTDQNSVRTGDSEKGKIKLDTKDLKSGIYYLHIQLGSDIYTHQIFVK